MEDYKEIFTTYLDDEGVKYSNLSKSVVRVPYTGENLKTIPIFVAFNDDGEPLVQIKCWEIANFKGKEEIAYKTCNQLNKQYRWLKFYLDNDADIIASVDTYVDEMTCGYFCLSLVRRAVAIIDEAYPTLARAMWA